MEFVLTCAAIVEVDCPYTPEKGNTDDRKVWMLEEWRQFFAQLKLVQSLNSFVILAFVDPLYTSTAVVQGFLQPLVARYAKNLATKLKDWGYEREVAIMQSNGGVAPLRQLGQRSAYIVRSGPAAGAPDPAVRAAPSGRSASGPWIWPPASTVTCNR
jgi:hypothetical protein